MLLETKHSNNIRVVINIDKIISFSVDYNTIIFKLDNWGI